MIEYMIEVNFERMVTMHLSIALFGAQITINDISEHDLFNDGNIGTTEVHHIEMNFGKKFMLFREELRKIKGIDSVDINRFEIIIFKGKLFNWKNIIHDVIHLLLCFYDDGDGKVGLIEFEMKKEAKKQIIKAKRESFKNSFPKVYNIDCT